MTNATYSSLWEYHFVLHTCNLSSRTKTILNPFTREEIVLPADDGLTEKEAEAVLSLFREQGIGIRHRFAEYPGYCLYANDWISFRCYELKGSTPVESFDTFVTVSDLSDEILATILRLAREGNLAFTSQLGKLVRIVDRHPNTTERSRWPDAEKLSTNLELRHWLQEEVVGELVESRTN